MGRVPSHRLSPAGVLEGPVRMSRPRRKARRRLWIIILVGFVLLGYYLLRPPALGTRESLNILIVGVDGVVAFEPSPAAPRESAPVAQAIGLLSLHPGERSAHLLLFPGHIPVPPDPDDPFAPYTEPRPLYELIDGLGAPSLIRYVEETLDVPVHHFVRIDSLSFVQLVDRVGGLRLPDGNVESPDLSELPAVPMSGEQVHRYLQAARRGESRVPDIAAQAAVFQAALEAIRGHRRFIHVQHFLQFAQRHLETDIPAEKLLAISRHLFTIPGDKIRIEVVPGHMTGDRYTVDKEALAGIVARTYRNKVRPSEREAGTQ